MLKSKEREQVRAKIRETIDKLEGEIPKLEEQAKPVAPDDAIGRLSRMEAIGSKSVAEATLRASKQRLSKLKVTLSQVDHEDFGLCRQCDEPIPLARMLAMPEKDICVDCAGKRA